MKTLVKPRCRHLVSLAVSAMFAFAHAAETAESDRALVFLRPEMSHLWSTAPGGSVEVAVPFPPGSESAVLTVTGHGYSAVHEPVTTDPYLLELPSPTSFDDENVYELKLEFDDGSVLTAKLGGIYGFDRSNAGVTRCLGGGSSADWSRVRRKAVLPIPYAAGPLTVDGTEAESACDGTASWWMYLPGDVRNRHSLVLADGDDGYSASLFGNFGFLFIAR